MKNKLNAFTLFLCVITAPLLFAQTNTSTTSDSLLLAQNLKQITTKQKPASFASSYTFDPKLNLYFYNVKVGEIDAEKPLALTPDEYRQRVFAEKSRNIFVRNNKH